MPQPSIVLAPEAFNERFTIYLNIEGKPVERTLREMTAGEVLAAVRWHNEEVDRLDREAEPARKFAEAVKARRLDPDMTCEGFKAACQDASAKLVAAGEASEKLGRLLRLAAMLRRRAT